MNPLDDPMMLASVANLGKTMTGGVGGSFIVIPLLNGEELRIDMYAPDVMPKDDPYFVAMTFEIKGRFMYELMISAYEPPPMPEIEDTGSDWDWSIGAVPEDKEPTEMVLYHVFRKPKIRSRRFLSVDKVSTPADFEEALCLARILHLGKEDE